MPKGIDKLTLEKVQQVLSLVQSPGLNSYEVAYQRRCKPHFFQDCQALSWKFSLADGIRFLHKL